MIALDGINVDDSEASDDGEGPLTKATNLDLSQEGAGSARDGLTPATFTGSYTTLGPLLFCLIPVDIPWSLNLISVGDDGNMYLFRGIDVGFAE